MTASHIQRKLVQDLVRIRVRPYYLYQCDLVEGAGHFRTPVAKGIEIIEGLRGHTSGYASPDLRGRCARRRRQNPGQPNYLISMSDHKIILRNYEGYITAYEEPLTTSRTIPKTCSYCQNKRSNPARVAFLACWMATRCLSSQMALTSCTTAAVGSTACAPTPTNGPRWGLGRGVNRRNRNNHRQRTVEPRKTAVSAMITEEACITAGWAVLD